MKKYFIALSPVVLILFTLFFLLNFSPVHDWLFKTRPYLSADSRRVFDFIQGGDELPDKISLREVEHLEDVRRLIKNAKYLFVASFLLVCFSFVGNPFYLQLLRAGFISLISGLVVGLASFSFNVSFTWFHTLLFTPGSWIFKRTDLLIILYPKDFFFYMFLYIVLDTLILGLIALFLGVLLRRDTYNLLQ